MYNKNTTRWCKGNTSGSYPDIDSSSLSCVTSNYLSILSQHEYNLLTVLI